LFFENYGIRTLPDDSRIIAKRNSLSKLDCISISPVIGSKIINIFRTRSEEDPRGQIYTLRFVACVNSLL
jgi:hypothetical protein